MPMSADDWPELGRRVKARREAMSLNQDELGPSDLTIRKLERGVGRDLRAKTLEQVEAALQWPPGLAMRIVKGNASEATHEDELQQRADPASLAAAVRERRVRLGDVTQQWVTERGGPSTETQRLIEGARQGDYSHSTLRKMDRGLGWPQGTALRFLQGDVSSADRQALLDSAVTDDRATVRQERTAQLPCACVVGSQAWIERELATERRINTLVQVFQGEIQRLLALVEAIRRAAGS